MRWSSEVSAAGWIGPRLDPFGSGLLTSVVPNGFASYARILHPATAMSEGTEVTVRWSEVAAWSGLPLEVDSQFHDIALPERHPGTSQPWSQGPSEGRLTTEDAAVLAEILGAHTESPQRCWFGLWDGYGWDNAVAYSFPHPEETGGSPRLPDPIPTEVREGPRVRLPDRDYLLYTGSVEDALAFAETKDQPANLWWSDDRPWCVASEIDLPWTYIGGSAELIRQVLADPRIEAQPAKPTDNMHFRVRGWLADAADQAATEVLTTGQCTVHTALGRMHASLAGNRIRISHENDRGVSGGKLVARGEAAIREEVTWRISGALAALADDG